MSDRDRRLRRGAATLTLGHAVLTGGQWLTLAIVARLSGPDALGRYALALGVASPLFLLSNLGLRTVQATDVGDERTSASIYLRLRVWTSSLAVLLLLAINQLLWSGEAVGMVLAVGGLKFAESISDVMYGAHQREGWMGRIAASSAIRGVSLVTVVLVTLLVGASADQAVLLGASTWALVAVALDTRVGIAPSKRASGPPASPLAAAHIAALAWPMGGIAALDSLNSNSAKYLLDFFVDVAAVGQYTAALSVVLMGGVVLSGLGNAALPQVAELWSQGEVDAVRRVANRLTRWVVGAGLLLSLAAYFTGEALLSLLFGPALEDTGRLLFFLFLAGTLWYGISVWGFVLNGIRAFRQQLPLFGGMALTSVGVGLALIPPYGIYGAAWAFTASLAVRAVGTWWIWRSAVRLEGRT